MVQSQSILYLSAVYLYLYLYADDVERKLISSPADQPLLYSAAPTLHSEEKANGGHERPAEPSRAGSPRGKGVDTRPVSLCLSDLSLPPSFCPALKGFYEGAVRCGAVRSGPVRVTL